MKKSNRRHFLQNTALSGIGILLLPPDMQTIRSTGIIYPTTATAAITDKLAPAINATMKGYIGNKLDLSYRNRLLTQDVDHLIQPFRNRTETRLWQSEFWGKWFTSAVLAYRYRPQPQMKKKLDDAVKELLATQTEDGYIGNYKKEHRLEQWDIWGMKYNLLGLLDYYDLTKHKKTLNAASRLADYLIKEINDQDGIIVTKGNYRGMAASSVLEPIIRLYNATGSEKYLSFAQEIVKQWETADGPRLISKASVNVSERFPKPQSWYSWEQGQKAYEMMSCYEGLLELYRVTGIKEYRDAVEKTWQNIRDTEINITGSGASEEMWFNGRKRQTQPVAHFQETCVTVTWIKLNQQLLRLTGESKYAEEIERSYYNALLGSLNADATDWAKYTPLNGERLPGSGQCGMNLNCCNASGPRGQFTLPHTVVMSTHDGLTINFYVEGLYELKTPKGKRIILHQETNYPVTGKIELHVTMSGNEEMTIRLRIPSWSTRNKVMLNKAVIPSVTPGSYLELKKVWSQEDIIQVDLDMRGRVVQSGDDYGNSAAVMKGPVVLTRDSRLLGPHLSTINKPLTDKEGFIDLKQIDKEDEYWMVFEGMFVPEAYTEHPAPPIPIQLCDYSSAGNGKERSVFQVWMPQLYSGRL